jgi:hypothetical protein
MKTSELVSHVAGFAAEVILSGIAASWNEVTVTYRIIYVVLMGSLFLAAWVKPKPHKGNDTTDNNPLHALVYEPSNKSSDSAAKG